MEPFFCRVDGFGDVSQRRNTNWGFIQDFNSWRGENISVQAGGLV